MGSVLTVLIFLPLLGVLPIYLWREDDRKHIGMTALGVSLITAVIGVVVLAGYLGEVSSKGHYGGFCLETQVHWLGSPEEASSELGARGST